MEPKGSLSHSQQPTPCLCPESQQSIPFLLFPLLEDPFLIFATHLRLGLPSGCFPSGLATKTLYGPLLSPIRASCPTHLILLDLITLNLCPFLSVRDQASHPYKTTGKTAVLYIFIYIYIVLIIVIVILAKNSIK